MGTTTESTFELDVVGDIRSTLDANINGLTVGKGGGSVATNTMLGVTGYPSGATGTFNVNIGYTNLIALTNGTSNVAVGGGSGYFLQSGGNNIFLGYAAGRVVVTGGNNINIGSYSGYSNTANSNIYIGVYTGFDATTSSNNTFIGDGTGRGITTGGNNTIIGANVTGLSSSLSNTIILADGQGNQRLYINSSGNVGIGTTSPSYKLDVSGNQNIYGGVIGDLSTNSSEILNLRYNSTSGNQINLNVSGLRTSNGTDWNGTILRMRYHVDGTTFANIDFKGSAGIETSAIFRATNLFAGTGDVAPNFNKGMGVIYSATSGTPAIAFASRMENNPSANVSTYAGYFNNIGTASGTGVIYSIYAANGIFQTEQGARLATSSGNVLIGTTTDAGYKLDVNGTARVNNGGDSYYALTVGNSSIANGRILLSSTSIQDINSSSGGYFRFESGYVGIFGGGSGARGIRFGHSGTTDIQIYPNGSMEIGNTGVAPSSASLQINSTTKGFLPPRQTQAQRTAITSPAVGLVVYQTDGTEGLYVYLSTGWKAVAVV